MNNLLICKGKSRNSCSFLAFLLFTFLLVAPTAAQTLKENNITLRVQNEPVENVFNKIHIRENVKLGASVNTSKSLASFLKSSSSFSHKPPSAPSPCAS